MIACRKLHVVDMKTGQSVRERIDVHGVTNEAKVLFDLGVAGIMPVTDGRVGEFLEEQCEIAFERNFLQRFAVFDA